MTRSEASLWRDPDKRRAALLSVFLHLVALLLLLYVVTRPQPEPLPSFIVIDLGTPAFSEEYAEAATAEAPTVEAPEPQVASTEAGDPQELAAPQQETIAEELEQATVQPPAPEAPPAAQAAPEPAPVQAEVTPPPPPQVQEVATEAPDLPVAEAPASQLPEVELEVLANREVPAPITIPEPQLQAQVAESRALALAPAASTAQAREVTSPEATAAVAQPVQLQAPRVDANVSSTVAVAAPDVSAAVAPSVALDASQVRAAVASSVSLSAEGVAASVNGTRRLADPSVSAVVGTGVPLDVTPTAQVVTPRPLATPQLRATVTGPQAPGAPQEGAVAEGATDVRATVESPRPAGGNAVAPGQTGPPDPNANVENRGLAAGPDGEGAGDGARRPPAPPPLAEQRDRALAVVIDNANGYPQSGLAQASMVVEMPVEGGITRLLAYFDAQDPQRVGPVRSARPYFVELAQRSEAVLVHDGGSPDAMVMIAGARVPTLNAYTSGDLFGRSDERSAPYNLYSVGNDLRAAVNRIAPERVRLVANAIYTPSQEAREVAEVTVSYGAYTSGFRFNQVTGRYRWVRAGEPAVQPDGQVLETQAVLVGDIEVVPIPGDDAGRLYIPIRSGPATLYLNGRAVDGTWEVVDGFGVSFVSDAGQRVDLAKLRTWVVLSPNYETRAER
ncbi:MAG TPA: DUF3048 domain-containing protein [Trueperaceae bacterium]|nr:DUF3048 domain-containing protein [Trueperaceae bacterium]